MENSGCHVSLDDEIYAIHHLMMNLGVKVRST